VGIHILFQDDCNSHRDKVVCTCYYFQLIEKQTLKNKELLEPKTLGDYLKKARLERKLSQPKVAKIFGVVTDSVTYWETNHHQPTIKEASRIIKFLGYFPFETENVNLYD